MNHQPPFTMKFLRIALFTLLAAIVPTAAYANVTFEVTGTGSAAGQTIYQGVQKIPRLVEIRATGTWGGTTITVQTSSDGGTTWIDAGVSLTANGSDYAYVVAGDLVRVTATGGTGISLTVLIR